MIFTSHTSHLIPYTPHFSLHTFLGFVGSTFTRSLAFPVLNLSRNSFLLLHTSLCLWEMNIFKHTNVMWQFRLSNQIIVEICSMCTLIPTQSVFACIGKSSFNFSLKPSRFFAAVKSSVLKIFPVSKALAGNLKENTPGLVRYVLAPWRLFYHRIVLWCIISPRLHPLVFYWVRSDFKTATYKSLRAPAMLYILFFWWMLCNAK